MPVVYVEKMSQTVNTGNLREEKREGDFLRAMYSILVYFYHYPGLCGGLPNPANGQATLAGRTSGSTATYTCNNGYQLTGVQTRTCQNTGMWSGMAPTCTRMSVVSGLTSDTII